MERLEIIKLLEIYSKTLTDHQNEIASLYFYEDLSLSEIAEEKKISRTAVHLTINRITEHLTKLEKELNIKEKYDRIYEVLEKYQDDSQSLIDHIKKVLL